MIMVCATSKKNVFSKATKLAVIGLENTIFMQIQTKKLVT